MTNQRVYEVLADSFAMEGVDTCFTLLGDANMNWASALADKGCRFIYVRHEHCAVAAAMAYARSTGRVGVASVTCGPGLTQVLTALPAAVRAGIPLLIFAGEAPQKSTWYNQGIDQKPFVDACGAKYVALRHQTTMRQQLRDAFLEAKTTRLPVVAGVPLDLQSEVWSSSLEPVPASDELIPVSATPVPAVDSVRAAADLIDSRKRIVVLAGLGIVRAAAGPVCRTLAEKTGGLLATTLPARGLFHGDPWCLGVAGGFSTETARKYLSQADLIIAIGTSLASHSSDNEKLFTADKVLHVDLQPKSINHGRQVAVYHLSCDASSGVEVLANQVVDRQIDDSKVECADYYWRTDELAEEIKQSPAHHSFVDPVEPGLLDPRDVVASLDKLIPPNWYTVNSSGHCSFFFAQMKNQPAERFLTIREFGAIGNGLSFAMGVAAAHPDEPVVLFEGDGSFLMHIQELETIHRHKMNIMVIIMNDGAYGSEVHKLRAEGLPLHGAVFGRPDFASIAGGFGIQGATVTSLSQLPDLIKDFAARVAAVEKTGHAAIIDVHVSDKVVSSVIQRSHPQ